MNNDKVRTKSAEKALSLPPPQREDFVKKKFWINYDDAVKVLEELDLLLKATPEDRMPCLLTIAESNNGKSDLFDYFRKKHPPVGDDNGNAVSIPLLCVSAPASPDEAEFLSNIITEFGVPFNPAQKPRLLLAQALRLIHEYKVRLLLIDEFNQIGTGTAGKQRHFLHRLRLFSKAARISIAGAGTPESIGLTTLDRQFKTRFPLFPLRRWKKGEDRTLSLLAAIECRLPFPEWSNLDSISFSNRLIDESEGTIGDLIELTEKMACYAISVGASRLTVEMIKDVGWIKPSQRASSIKAML